MRPLAFLAAAIPLALGCAQQSRTGAADLAPDQGLEVQLTRPAGGGLIYSLNEPAYVAIFEVIPRRRFGEAAIRDSGRAAPAFQSIIPLRSFCLRVSGAVAPSAPPAPVLDQGRPAVSPTGIG